MSSTKLAMGDAMKAAGMGLAVSVGALVGPVLVASFLGKRVSSEVIFSAITIAGITIPALVRKTDGRAMGVRILAPLAWLPLIALMLFVNHEALFNTPAVMRCGNGLIGLMVAVPVLMAPLLALSCTIAPLLRSAKFDRVFLVASIALFLGTFSITALAATRITRPDPDTYLASLPVSTLHVGESTVLNGTHVSYRETYEKNANELGLTADAPAVSMNRCRLEGLHDLSGRADLLSNLSASSCPTLTLKHDVKSNVWLVSPEDNSQYLLSAIVMPGGATKRELIESDVSASIGPPIGWTIGGFLAVIVGAAFLFAARRNTARATDVKTICAEHRGEGWVDVPSSHSVHFAALQSAPLGPVLLRMRTSSPATYRQTGADHAEFIFGGSLEDYREAILDHSASLTRAAFASMLLLATPLAWYLLFQ